MSFKVKEPVRWTSSNTKKEGIVEAVIPAGKRPCDVGFPNLGDSSMPRDHETYVVRGGVPGKRPSLYWPLVSLLSSAEGLTADEMAWCHKNANRVRELIASTGR